MTIAAAAAAALLSHAPMPAAADAPIQTAPAAVPAAAPAPAPAAPPPFKLINHDESYAYLADPAKRTSAWSKFKYVPVGGEGTHSVLTAHRGLATAELFTRLDEVVVGVMPFLVAELVVLALLTIFPSLVLVPMRWFF